MGEIIGARELKSRESTQEGSKEVCLTHPFSISTFRPRFLLLVVVASARAVAALGPAPGTYIYSRPSSFRHDP